MVAGQVVIVENEKRRVVGAMGLALVCGCEVHGLIGSNVTAGAEEQEPPFETSTGDTGFLEVTSNVSSGDDTSGGLFQTSSGESSTGEFIWDVGVTDGPKACLAPVSPSCDQGSDDPANALGINCLEGDTFDVDFNGHPDAQFVHQGQLGHSDVFAPREGERMLILSTGRARDIPRTHRELGCDPDFCPSTDFDPTGPLHMLPPPVDVRRVDDEMTCDIDKNLVGEGDCSNTLESQWMAGNGAFDYAELRLSATVPPGTDAIAYEFAFFSAEYPLWVDHSSEWNDMYIAWLESEEWTGNISFDEMGNPISINAVFLDYLDADSHLCTKSPCEAPELTGFAMDGHAATRWLETVAPVVSGEEITLVFAIFDMTDSSIDSAVVLDNVHWACTNGIPPITTPVG